MAYRTSTTEGRALVHVEVERLGEMPEGTPAPDLAPEDARSLTLPALTAGQPFVLPAPEDAPAAPRRGPGRPFTSADAVEAGRRGALAGWQKRREEAAREEAAPKILEALGLRSVPPEGLLQYLDLASGFATYEVERLAQTVGGGVCGAGPASLVQSAALQLGCSRHLFALGDPSQFKLAASLANDSRQNLLAAHELCAREAKARAEQPGENDIDRLRKRMAADRGQP